MPIKYSWEDASQEILLFDLTIGDWTWEQYDRIVDEVFAIVQAIPHTVSVIILPPPHNPHGSPLPHLQRVLALHPKNIDVFVLVNANYFTRSINQLMIKLYPQLSKRLIFVRDIDEAHKQVKLRHTATSRVS